MIKEYTINELAEAEATPHPRHVWINGDRVIVYTGEDMPNDPIEEP